MEDQNAPLSGAQERSLLPHGTYIASHSMGGFAKATSGAKSRRQRQNGLHQIGWVGFMPFLAWKRCAWLRVWTNPLNQQEVGPPLHHLRDPQSPRAVHDFLGTGSRFWNTLPHTSRTGRSIWNTFGTPFGTPSWPRCGATLGLCSGVQLKGHATHRHNK